MQPTLFEWEHCVDRFWRKKKGSVVQQSWLSLRAIWHHPARWCVGQSDTSKCSFRVLITRVLYYSFLPRNLCMKDKMAVHVIRRSKFQPHNIINPCEVFWHLTSLMDPLLKLHFLDWMSSCFHPTEKVPTDTASASASTSPDTSTSFSTCTSAAFSAYTSSESQPVSVHTLPSDFHPYNFPFNSFHCLHKFSVAFLISFIFTSFLLLRILVTLLLNGCRCI